MALIEETSNNLKQIVNDIDNYPDKTTEGTVANLYLTAMDKKDRKKADLSSLKSYLKATTLGIALLIIDKMRLSLGYPPIPSVYNNK